MKNLTYGTVVVLLGIGLFIAALPISSAAPNSPTNICSSPRNQETSEREHFKKGSEIEKRVKQLEKYNKNVSAALAAFEKEREPKWTSAKTRCCVFDVT